MTKQHEPRKTDVRKTDKPEGERTVPDVPQPLPPAEPGDHEELVGTQDSGPPEEQVPVQTPPPPASSAVNLGRPGAPVSPGQTPSGEIPSDPWTDLLRESPHDSGPSEPARFDDPADADVLQRALAQEAAEAKKGTGAAAAGPLPQAAYESSRVDLGEKVPEADVLASSVQGANLGEDDSAIFVAEAVAEPGEEPVESNAEVFTYDSGVELPGGVHEVEAEPSAVDLGAAPVPRPEDSSGVNLGGSGVPSAVVMDSSSGLDLEGAVILDDEEPLPASAVDLASGVEAVVVDSSSVLPGSGAEELPRESSQSDVFVGADAGPAGEAAPSSISGLNLGQSAGEVIQVDSDSGMKLGPGGVPLDEDEVGTISLSPGEPGAEVSEGTSSVNLGMPLKDKGSDRDLIAEAVESGVELEPGSGKHPETGSFAEVVLGEPPASGGGDSAVNLGGPAVDDEDEIATALRAGAPDTDLTRKRKTGGLEGARKTSVAGPDEVVPHPADELADSFEPAPGQGDADVEDSVISTLVDKQSAGVAAGEQAAGASDVEEEEETFTAGPGEVEEEPVGEEEPAAKEEEKRVRPSRPKVALHWAGGILVGAVLCAGLWKFGPLDLRDGAKSESPEDKNVRRALANQPKPPTVAELLENGDFNKEVPAIDEADPVARTTRGRYKLLQYLSQTEPKNIKREDYAVQEALKDFQEAAKQNNADAYLWQGFVYESLNDLKQAQQIYQEGAKKFENDKAQKERFDSALDRLQVTSAKAAGALLRPPARFDAAQLVLLLVMLQSPPPGQPQDRPEAGVAFWRAARLARDRQYDKALEALAKARKDHDDNRRSRLYRAQNPTSDPLENIFLRACDELKAYWELQKKLSDQRYPSLDAVFTDLSGLKEAKRLADKRNTDLEKEKTDAVAKNTTLQTALDKETKAKTDAETAVKDRDKKLERAAKDLDDEKTKLAKERAKVTGLEKEKTDLTTSLNQIGDELKLDPKQGLEPLVLKVKDLVKTLKMNNAAEELVKAQEENRRLAKRRSSEAMLSYWLPLLADRARQEVSTAALEDAERVRADDKSTPAAKALTLAVTGLAQRNRRDFAKARQTLKEAEDAAGGATWKDLVTKARKQLDAPAEFYLPQAETLRDQGRFAEALELLDEGVKAFPTQSGRLLALRSLVRLDAALAKARGKLREDSPGVQEARADAEAAINSKPGSEGAGHFAAGRIAEALRKYEAAAKSYDKAAGEAPPGSIEATRYSLAGERARARQADGRGALLPGPREGKAGAGRPFSVRELLVMTMIGLQQLTPEEQAQKKRQDLADQILKRPDIERYPLEKAQALAIKGLWNEALNTCVESLRQRLRPDQLEVLEDIIKNHPGLHRVVQQRVPQRSQAERHYLAGLSRYYASDFANAEKEFAQAIMNFDQDARYHYFLGLARLQQGKRGNTEDFDEAARLEAGGHPARDAVDNALERIQGDLRRLIRDVRNRTP
jgi:hypothetical protein